MTHSTASGWHRPRRRISAAGGPGTAAFLAAVVLASCAPASDDAKWRLDDASLSAEADVVGGAESARFTSGHQPLFDDQCMSYPNFHDDARCTSVVSQWCSFFGFGDGFDCVDFRSCCSGPNSHDECFYECPLPTDGSSCQGSPCILVCNVQLAVCMAEVFGDDSIQGSFLSWVYNEGTDHGGGEGCNGCGRDREARWCAGLDPLGDCVPEAGRGISRARDCCEFDLCEAATGIDYDTVGGDIADEQDQCGCVSECQPPPRVVASAAGHTAVIETHYYSECVESGDGWLQRECVEVERGCWRWQATRCEDPNWQCDYSHSNHRSVFNVAQSDAHATCNCPTVDSREPTERILRGDQACDAGDCPGETCDPLCYQERCTGFTYVSERNGRVDRRLKAVRRCVQFSDNCWRQQIEYCTDGTELCETSTHPRITDPDELAAYQQCEGDTPNPKPRPQCVAGTICGNGFRSCAEIGGREICETCDTRDLNGKSCADVANNVAPNEGTLACDDQCQFDTSGCNFCTDFGATAETSYRTLGECRAHCCAPGECQRIHGATGDTLTTTEYRCVAFQACAGTHECWPADVGLCHGGYALNGEVGPHGPAQPFYSQCEKGEDGCNDLVDEVRCAECYEHAVCELGADFSDGPLSRCCLPRGSPCGPDARSIGRCGSPANRPDCCRHADPSTTDDYTVCTQRRWNVSKGGWDYACLPANTPQPPSPGSCCSPSGTKRPGRPCGRSEIGDRRCAEDGDAMLECRVMPAGRPDAGDAFWVRVSRCSCGVYDDAMVCQHACCDEEEPTDACGGDGEICCEEGAACEGDGARCCNWEGPSSSISECGACLPNGYNLYFDPDRQLRIGSREEKLCKCCAGEISSSGAWESCGPDDCNPNQWNTCCRDSPEDCQEGCCDGAACVTGWGDGACGSGGGACVDCTAHGGTCGEDRRCDYPCGGAGEGCCEIPGRDPCDPDDGDTLRCCPTGGDPTAASCTPCIEDGEAVASADEGDCQCCSGSWYSVVGGDRILCGTHCGGEGEPCCGRGRCNDLPPDEAHPFLFCHTASNQCLGCYVEDCEGCGLYATDDATCAGCCHGGAYDAAAGACQCDPPPCADGACDDGNPCTEDRCLGGGACQHDPREWPCDDGDPCTVGDTCVDGDCAPGIGGPTEEGGAEPNGDAPLAPFGTNVVLSWEARFPEGTTAASPGRAPKPGGVTARGSYAPSVSCDEGNPCTVDLCHLLRGCLHVPRGCDDGEPCTEDSCGVDGCLHTPRQGNCDDGDACTWPDACRSGRCVGPDRCACDDDEACDDGDPCTADTCDAGRCAYVHLSSIVCDDGDPCTTEDECVDGVCTGNAVPCDDGEPCTTDRCAGGDCTREAVAGACDDGDACTVADRCRMGSCEGRPRSCADGDPCTDDLCAGGECLHTSNDAPCSDGDPCTVDDRCGPQGCLGIAGRRCDDDNACTLDICSEGSCEHRAEDGASCDDGDACTIDDVCARGRCIGSLVDCDDEDDCNGSERCDPATGACADGPPMLCDDGDPCNGIEACGGGECAPGLPIDCSDGDPCNGEEVCEGSSGSCAPGAPVDCDDGDACNGREACGAGGCRPGIALDCDDADPCTDDRCEAGACRHVPNGAPCDDGDACTEGDHCTAGGCRGTFTCDCVDDGDCDDGNPCTADACVAGACVATPDDVASCVDGDPCTIHDRCRGGACAGTPRDCGDGNPCTADSCQEGACRHDAVEGPCDDGDPCTTADSCSGGLCAGTAGGCPDIVDASDAVDDGGSDGGDVTSDPGVASDDGDGQGDGSGPVDNGAADHHIGDDGSVDVPADGDPCASVHCDDGNECTDDACSGGICFFVDRGGPCEDGDPCTSGDSCARGACVGGMPTCDDIADVVDASDVVAGDGTGDPGGEGVTGDVGTDADAGADPGHPADGATDSAADDSPSDAGEPDDAREETHADACAGLDCDDGDPCNGAESCHAGICQPGVSVECDDGDDCNGFESCDPSSGGCVADAPLHCDDGDPCNGTEHCTAGSCQTGTSVACDDGDDCNGFEWCDSATGDCVAGSPMACDDGDPCNGVERCAAGSCQSGVSVECDDGDDCNGLETCDPATGACVVTGAGACPDADAGGADAEPDSGAADATSDPGVDASGQDTAHDAHDGGAAGEDSATKPETAGDASSEPASCGDLDCDGFDDCSLAPSDDCVSE